MRGVQGGFASPEQYTANRKRTDEWLRLQLVVVQGDSADSMLSWVVEQQGQDAMKDPNLAKQVTLAVLRHAIPNPKVTLLAPPHPPTPVLQCVFLGEVACSSSACLPAH